MYAQKMCVLAYRFLKHVVLLNAHRHIEKLLQFAQIFIGVKTIFVISYAIEKKDILIYGQLLNQFYLFLCRFRIQNHSG